MVKIWTKLIIVQANLLLLIKYRIRPYRWGNFLRKNKRTCTIIRYLRVIDLTNNGNRQGHDQHARNGATCTNDLAHPRNRGHVTITDGGHGNDRPPEGGRNGREGGAGLLLLGKVAQRRKDQDSHSQEEHEQAQLLVAVFEGEGDGLEARGMPRQLENSHDTHDPEHLDDSTDVVEGGPALLLLFSVGKSGAGSLFGGGGDERLGVDALGLHQEERHVVRQDGQYVNHVHGAFHELPFLRRALKSKIIFIIRLHTV